MYAIIEESGGQRRVQQGDVFDINLEEAGELKLGSTIKFDRVLVVGAAGGKAKLGQPYVAGASVSAEVVDPMIKGEKQFVQMYRDKKTWQKKRGHRQPYTRVKVTAIAG